MKNIFLIALVGLLASCVSSKKFKALEKDHAGLQAEYQRAQQGLTSSQNLIVGLYGDRDSLSSIVF